MARLRAGSPHGGGYADRGMPREQPQQFDAGVTGRPCDANPDGGGISIHQNV
jgi:hypothetical protein